MSNKDPLIVKKEHINRKNLLFEYIIIIIKHE